MSDTDQSVPFQKTLTLQKAQTFTDYPSLAGP